MVTAGATANTTEGNSRASRESGLLCSHSHGESIDQQLNPQVEDRRLKQLVENIHLPQKQRNKALTQQTLKDPHTQTHDRTTNAGGHSQTVHHAKRTRVHTQMEVI